MAVYNLTVAECPSYTPATGGIDPNSDPLLMGTLEEILLGESLEGLLKLNRNAARTALLGRYSGGGPAIVEGFTLTDEGGLTGGITAGTIMEDGPRENPSAQTADLTDDTRNYAWILSDGSLAITTTTVPPEAGAFYVGSYLVASGAITELDESCVMRKLGGIMYRRSADVGAPSDDPGATTSFIHISSDNRLYLWTGSEYIPLSSTPLVTVIDDTDSPYTAVERNEVILADATNGPITVNLLPASTRKGFCFTVKKVDATANDVTIEGAESETFDGAANHTLSAQWERATFMSDGTNFVRID